MSENNSLDLLPLSPNSGCDPRGSRTHQDQLMLCWSVWDWLQHLTSSSDAGMGRRWFPQVFSPMWVGSGPRACHPPRTSHLSSCSCWCETTVTPQMGFALPVAELSCAESGPKFPGVPCAGRGNSLPCLPVPL